MIKAEDFTRGELIRAIADWLRTDDVFDMHACDIADDLESGKWLEHYNERLQLELPHSNC